MSLDPQALLREALSLPDSERADMAAELLASLDEPTTEDLVAVREVWAREIERRARRALAGETSGEDWHRLRQRLTDDFVNG